MPQQKKKQAISDPHILYIHSHNSLTYDKAVLDIKTHFYSFDLKVKGHGFQNKQMETTAGKWTQEMHGFLLGLMFWSHLCFSITETFLVLSLYRFLEVFSYIYSSGKIRKSPKEES